MGVLSDVLGGISGAATGFMVGGPVGALVGGGIGLLGAHEQGEAAEDAAKASREAATQSMQAQLEAARLQDAYAREAFNRSQAGLWPTQVGSNRAQSQLSALMGLGYLPTNAPFDVERAYIQQQIRDLEATSAPVPTPQAMQPGSGSNLSNLAASVPGLFGLAGGGLAGRLFDRASPVSAPALTPQAPSQAMSPQTQSQLAFLRERLAAIPNEPMQQMTPAQARETALGNFYKDPGYEFRLAEGQKAIDRVNAARGRLGGAGIKDLMRFNQGLASDEYGRYVGNLQSMAGFAPVAAQAQGAGAMQYGGQLGAIAQGIGDARTSAYQQIGATNASQSIAQGNQLAGFTNNLLNADWSGIGSKLGGYFGGSGAQPGGMYGLDLGAAGARIA